MSDTDSQIKTIDEFTVCFDITTRMALVALARSTSSDDEIDQIFEGIKIGLNTSYKQDFSEMVDDLISQFKPAVKLLRAEIQKEETKDG